MNVNEILLRDCFLYDNQIYSKEIKSISEIENLSDEDIKKYSNIYKLYLVRNYALEYSKNMESLDRYKLNYKYGNVDVIGKLFWSLFICNDEDFEKIEEVIKSVVNFDDVSFLRKSCSKIEKFGLELMCIENEDVQIIGELVKSRLKLYLDELSFKTNNNFTNKYEELERCYQICIDCEWNIYKIKKVASRKGIVLVINKAREFAICKLHLTNEQFKVLINNSNRNSTNKKYQELIDRIVYEKNDDKIFEIIDEYSFSKEEIDAIKINLFYYVASKLKIDEYNRVNQLVLKTKNKLDRYLKYSLNRERKIRNNNFNKLAIEYVNEFIISEYESLTEYLKDKKIIETEFNTYLRHVNKIDKNLYNLYLATLAKKKEKLYNNVYSLTQKMLDEIVNGVLLEDGSVRKFDILDYYKYTDKDVSKMENLIFEIYEKGLLDEKKYRLFLRTIKNFINSTSFSNRDKLLNIEFSFGSNDKNGNVYMISLDDKLKVLDYLEKRKIPINNLTYVTVIRRYAKGWLEVDKFSYKK